LNKKKVIEHRKHFLVLSTTSVCNISHSKKNWARYDNKCVMVKVKIKQSPYRPGQALRVPGG